MTSAGSLEDRFTRAEEILEEHHALTAEGQDVDIDSLVAQHPALESELRALHALCGEVQRALAEGRGAETALHAEAERMLRQLGSDPGFAQRYEITGELGAGGMGLVLRALDRKLGRPLAMKVVVGQADARRTGRTPPIPPRKLARFLNEARITSQLEHPGIVPVHEVGVDPDGRAFFTMKLVKGRTLAEVLASHAAGDPDWNRTRVLTLIQRVCEAVAYAHDRGVIHRDLKPSNVMVGDFGEVYVMDWGLARTLGEAELPSSETRATDEELLDVVTGTRDGQVLGTPAYMPPEQAAGHIAEMGPRSDVYMIGSMLYQLLAGHAPYCGPGESTTATAVLRRIAQGPPAPLAVTDVEPELAAICARAMQREPVRRYGDVRELAHDVQAYLDGRVVKAYEGGPLAEARKWVQRNRALAWVLLAALGLALGGLAGIGYVQARGRTAERNQRLRAEAETAKVLRLSDLKQLDQLEAQAERLVPLRIPDRAALMDWLERAEQLLAHLPLHRQTLDHLRSQGIRRDVIEADGGTMAGDWRFEDPPMQWQHDLLAELVAKMEREREAGAATGMVARMRRTLEALDRSAIDPAALEAWSRAIDAIRSHPAYDGLVLSPQAGLLPLGPDPLSGLWEFAHLMTGEPPQRGSDTQWILTPATGVVLVLVPGGSDWLGAQKEDPTAPNYDPQMRDDEGPLRWVQLEPYFLSKYELTQAQWQRLTGANPAAFPEDPLHPVNMVSWHECERALRLAGLELPGEAQWEHAARAGTTTPWWTGADPEAVYASENLNDDAPGDRILPIGSLVPNPFGLYDMLGNVEEWCADWYDPDSNASPVPPDPRRLWNGLPSRVVRGGAWGIFLPWVRSASRTEMPAALFFEFIGVRPARAVLD